MWGTATGCLVDGMSLCKHGSVQAAVALLGRHEPDRAMAMLHVVPAHELSHPRPSVLQAGEGLARILWTVLQGAEQRLGVRIVITDRWSAKRRSEEHTSELQSLMRISYAVFCLKKK